MAEVRNCTKCSTNSENLVLLSTFHKGEEKWVCTRCFPKVIHGTVEA